MTILTLEQRQAIAQAGGNPLRVEDPETHQAYVIVKAEVFERLRTVLEDEEIDPSCFEIDDFEAASENADMAGRFPRGKDDCL
jgi:hypothetical protein